MTTLDSIPETTQEPPEAYSREANFGKAWLDVDGNRCDTRNDVLGQQLSGVEYVPYGDAPSRCRGATVYSGLLDDPYTGRRIEFTRDSPNEVQIDHVVPLSWAWRNGAWQWTQEQRIEFANDPENLLAVDGPSNQGKGDKGPGQWMPQNVGFHCEYAERFTTVVSSHGLTLPSEDREVLADTLEACASSGGYEPSRGASGGEGIEMETIREYAIMAVAVVLVLASVYSRMSKKRRRRPHRP
ncbi:HNH endonuclease family protein [Actinomycetaceae bacterium L2_0104]